MVQSATPAKRFAALVEALTPLPDVSYGAEAKKSFGANTLKVNNRIFAMLVQDRLVVKLPRSRVDELTAVGAGMRFDPGHGRVMKEWISLDPTAPVEWLPLAQEAMRFVAASR